MSGQQIKQERESDGPLRRVTWTLVSAMPYPVTGETINIGIIYEDEAGHRKLLKGGYRNRLKAFAPEPAVRRVIDTELLCLERDIENAVEIQDSRHIVQAERSTLVHENNQEWPLRILEQMVPGGSRSEE